MNLLSTHGVVLAAIAKDPYVRLRDLSKALDVTERTVWRAVEDLVTAGLLRRRKVGRRNIYHIVQNALIGDANLDITVGALLRAIGDVPDEVDALSAVGASQGDAR